MTLVLTVTAKIFFVDTCSLALSMYLHSAAGRVAFGKIYTVPIDFATRAWEIYHFRKGGSANTGRQNHLLST